MSHVRVLTAVALVLTLAAARGLAGADDDETGKISGKVAYKGKPLPGGTITFHPAKGKPVVVQIKGDGTFVAAAVPVGVSKVSVETESLKPKPDEKDCEKKPKDDRKYVPIPRFYGDPAKSGFNILVGAGDQTYDIGFE